MKRCIAAIVCLGAAGLLMAQGSFTIYRPANGSKVRETIHIQIPKNSVPEGGYVGVFVGGKFVEAVVPKAPSANSKFLQYDLDTKARKIPDGKVSIELVLYVNYSDQPRIVDRSAVEVYVANTSSINVPEDGLSLRYKFVRGNEYIYTVMNRVAVTTLSEVENKSGGKPGELPVEAEKIRMLYAVDNVYPNGDGLIRMQALPEKGKDYAWLTTEENTTPRKYMDYEMASIYMRLTNTGREVFGSIPSFWPFEGVSGEANRLDLFAAFPLPTLPGRPVQVGGSWQGSFNVGKIDLEKLYEADRVSKSGTARGELLGVEWESGHPCAKIQYTIELSEKSKEGQALTSSGASFGDEKTSRTETIWFALDKSIPVKMVSNTIIDRKLVTANPLGGGFGNNRFGGGPMGGPGMMGGPGGFPGAPGGFSGGKGDEMLLQRGTGGRGGRGQFGGPMGGPGGFPGAPGGFPGAPGGFGSGMMGGRNTGGGAPGQVQYLRLRIERIATLEK